MEGVGSVFPEVHVTECTAQPGKARVSFDASQPKNVPYVARLSNTDIFFSSLGISKLDFVDSMSGDGGIADPALVKQIQPPRQPANGGTIWYSLMLYLKRDPE